MECNLSFGLISTNLRSTTCSRTRKTALFYSGRYLRCSFCGKIAGISTSSTFWQHCKTDRSFHRTFVLLQGKRETPLHLQSCGCGSLQLFHSFLSPLFQQDFLVSRERQTGHGSRDTVFPTLQSSCGGQETEKLTTTGFGILCWTGIKWTAKPENSSITTK